MDYESLRRAEKVSLTLTGMPLSDSMKASFVRGEINLDQIAEALSKSPDFIENYAQYWSKLIGVQGGIDPYNFRIMEDGKWKDTISDRRNKGRTNQDRLADIADGWLTKTASEIDKTIKSRTFNADGSLKVPFLNLTSCKGKDGESYPFIYVKRDFSYTANAYNAWKFGYIKDNDKISYIKNKNDAALREAWGRMYEFLKSGDVLCDEGIPVKPWWDPKGTAPYAQHGSGGYRTAPLIVKLCGGTDDLPRCDLKNYPKADVYRAAVSKDMTLEAGYLIAHTVAEDQPFSDIVTTQDTIMTGIYGSFMSRIAGDLWGNYPDKSIADINHPIFKTPDYTDRKHYRIKRGPKHAGILTTPIYQLLTNGRRAKANKAYELLLCQKFTVPDGISPDPTDSNPDLTQRHYCNSCHRMLEPMAAYFNRWPQTGMTEFAYDNTGGVSDSGSFQGEFGSGVAAFGKSLANFERFDQCSIQRAFDFVNGRMMSKVEQENLIPKYLDLYLKSNKSLRAIIKAMISSEDFLFPKE